MSSVRVEVALDGSTSASPLLGAAFAAPGVAEASGAPHFHCVSKECFAALVRARADAHRTVVLAVTNVGFAHHWHNLRCSLERLDVARHAIIIGTDESACDAASAPSVPCVVGGGLFWGGGGGGGAAAASQRSLASHATRHGTAEYARLMHVKAQPCLEVLRLGFDVMYTDSDIVWTRDAVRAAASRAL